MHSFALTQTRPSISANARWGQEGFIWIPRVASIKHLPVKQVHVYSDGMTQRDICRCLRNVWWKCKPQRNRISLFKTSESRLNGRYEAEITSEESLKQFKEGCVSQWLLSPLSLIILLCVSHKWNTVSRLKSLFSGEAKQLQAELTFSLICLDCSWLYGLWSFLTFSIIFRILRVLWNIVFTSCCLWLQPGWRTWTCSTEQNTSPSHRC